MDNRGKLTSSDFAISVDTIAQSIRIRGNALNKPIAIVVDMNDSFQPHENVNFKYNADSSELELYVSAIKKDFTDINIGGINLRSELNLPRYIYPDIFNINRQISSVPTFPHQNTVS